MGTGRRGGAARRLCGAAVLAAALLMPAEVHAGAAAPTAWPYPVTYRVLPGVVANATDPTGSPPGANNWSCKPSAAHPTPVVLVHGLLATMQDNWNTMSPLLADNGYCVFALTYGSEDGEPYFGGVAAMEQSAVELGAFVTRVLAATGASRVDLVGHSEGTVMPRYWMEFLGGGRYVDRYVMFTPIWHGTQFYGAATIQQLGAELVPGFSLVEAQLFAKTCGSCPEFLTGSPFLRKLDAGGTALPGVTYTDIMTRYDELVLPYTSGNLAAPNVTNIVLQDQCPVDYSDHLTVAFDPTAAQDMLNALDPAHAARVPCVPVIAGFGALYPPS
jgi:triacylglycerol lipase